MLNELASRIITPYIIIAVVLVALAIFIKKAPLPVVDTDQEDADLTSDLPAKTSVFQYPHLMLGVLCLFLYVGAEVMAGDAIGVAAGRATEVLVAVGEIVRRRVEAERDIGELAALVGNVQLGDRGAERHELDLDTIFVGKRVFLDHGAIRDLAKVARPSDLGPRMGCFLFQLPPSFHYTRARLQAIIAQLDPRHRNVVEFRHASWWNEDVYDAFRKARAIFCACSGPRLPDELVKTADDIYIRFHGTKRWYRHDYSVEELSEWAQRIHASGARQAWIYFNNDSEGYAVKNARKMRKLLNSPARATSASINAASASQVRTTPSVYISRRREPKTRARQSS